MHGSSEALGHDDPLETMVLLTLSL